MKRLLLLAFLPMLLAMTKGIAQTEPIQVNTILNPPYSPRISDFGRVEATNLQAQIILNDFSIASLDVKLAITIKGSGITIKTKPNFQPRSPIVLMPGAPTTVMGSQLAEYLSPDNLVFQGYSAQQFRRTGRIPAGFYEFSFQVLHYNRGNALSTAFPAIVGRAWLIQHDPPFTIAPKQGDTIKAQDPQYLTFQWQPRHIGTPGANFATEYRLQLIELWPSDRNPNDAFLSSPILFETTTQATSYAYTVADAQLEKGRRYAYRIQAREYDPTAISTGFEQSSIFKNNGYSEVVSFDYMEECLPPTGVTARNSGSRAIMVNWTSQYNHLSTDVYYSIVGGITDHVYKALDTEGERKYLDRFGEEQLIEYSVRGKCEHNYSAFSRPQQIQLPPDEDFDLGACVVDGPLFEDFEPTTNEPLLELKVGDVITHATEDITILKVNKSLGNGWFTAQGEQPFTPWRVVATVDCYLQINANHELLDGEYEVISAIARPMKNIPMDKIRTGVTILNEVVSEVNLNFSSKDKNNTNGSAGLAPLDIANILSEGAEAAGEAITAIPQAVGQVPQATIDVMEGLRKEADELIEEAKEIASSSPEAAEQLLSQANDKLGQVVNTLESLPDVMDSALDGLAALGEDSDYFLQLLKEALEEFNGIMGDTLKKKQQQQGANDEALAEQLAAIEASNLAVEDEQAPLTPLYDEPQLVEDESTFRESEARKKGFTLLRKKKSFFVFLAQLQNVFTYIETLLENEEELKDLSEGFITKRRAEIFKLIQENKGLKGKEVELKLMMKDYMGSELVFLANEGKENEIEEFTDENLRTATVATENHAPLPTDKNYYISPLVPLSEEERDSVEMRLEAYLADKPNLFVNVAYSQDISNESYLERTQGGRPKGLDANMEYVTVHWINIPGSLMKAANIEGYEKAFKGVWRALKNYAKEKRWTEAYFVEKIFQEIRCAQASGLDVVSMDQSYRDVKLEGTNWVLLSESFIKLISPNFGAHGDPKEVQVKVTVTEGANEIEGVGKNNKSRVTEEFGHLAFTNFHVSFKENHNDQQLYDDLVNYLYASQEIIDVEVSVVKDEIDNLIAKGSNITKDDKEELLVQVKKISSCVAGGIDVLTRFKIIKLILYRDDFLREHEENAILDLMSVYNIKYHDPKEYANQWIRLFKENPLTLKQLFSKMSDVGGDDNFTRFLNEVFILWSVSDFSKDESYQYSVLDENTTSLSEISPYYVYYKKPGALSTKAYSSMFYANEGKVLVLYRDMYDGNIASFKYDLFQPVVPFNENDDETIKTLKTPIPACIFYANVKAGNYEQFCDFLGLYLDIALTITGLAELKALKYLSGAKKVTSAILASADLLSSATDILLKYSSLCEQGDTTSFCKELAQYNRYVQMGLLVTGVARSALNKAVTQGAKNNLIEAYQKDRHKLIDAYGENHPKIKELDELLLGKVDDAFIVVKNATSVLEVRQGVGAAKYMEKVRTVQQGEKVADLIEEVLTSTKNLNVEHAVVKLKLPNGATERAIVKGGPDGIYFKEGDIELIYGHTHTLNKPASLEDYKILSQLDQTKQYIALPNGKVVKIEIEKAANVAGKLSSILSKVDDLPNAKRLVNSLDEVDDAKLIEKLDELDNTKLTNLDNFYGDLGKNTPSPYTNADINFTASKTIEIKGVKYENGVKTNVSKTIDVDMTYKHGLPEFHKTEYCPEITLANGTTNKYKYVDNGGLDFDNYSSHFRNANRRLLDDMGLANSSKNAEGFYQSGNYRWNGRTPQFELKNANGVWEKYTWHHIEDGKTMIPVQSNVHTARSGGFTHAGGKSLHENGILGIFEFLGF